MQIVFEKDYLSELYYYGKSKSKKYRFSPEVVNKYIRRIITLAEAPNVESLFALNSLNYEVLRGDKSGLSSIRIDRKYRLEFIVSTENCETTITICTIVDISNHYK